MTEENSNEQGNEHLDLKIQSLSEEASFRFSKELGNNGIDAKILGYMNIPKLFNAASLDVVRKQAELAFGEGCKIYPIHPHDTLSECLRKKMQYFKDKTDIRYCIIYR
ncbi:MAG: hypothetical protein ACP5NW_02305 [Candidatus Woesearchaeota archaeon]